MRGAAISCHPEGYTTAVRRTGELLKLEMVRFAGSVLPTRTEIKNLLKACADGPISAAEMVASIDRQWRLFQRYVRKY